MNKIRNILIITPDTALKEVLNFCFDGWGYEVFLWEEYTGDIASIKKILPDVVVIDIHSAHKEDLKICEVLKDDPLTSSIPVITLIDKRHLKTQLLTLKHGIDDYLIKPPDPLDLRVRIEMAIRRAQYNLYSSPLTGLPGGKIIEEKLKEKIESNSDFSFGYIDIDNFKYFNDVYGYIKGDGIIMHTAYLLYNTIRKFGNRSDFIGHIGGDDFVFMTTPDKYELICKNFIMMFDKIMPFHYSQQDRKQKFIIARDRTHKMKKIPLVSVSIGIVNSNSGHSIESVIDVNDKIAQLKKYLKKIEGSTYMIDRRMSVDKNYLSPWTYNKKIRLKMHYKPLGQILLDRKVVSQKQLDEALNIHWKQGIILGEVLKELRFLKDEELTRALNIQMFSIYNLMSNS